MGLFDFLKKPQQSKPIPKPTESKPERLTAEGELPLGWLYRNKAFIDKLNGEYTYFLDMWIDSRRLPELDQYAALKSFVLFLEDAETLCKSKGECFELWFYDILASKEYIAKRKAELHALTERLKSK